MGAKVPLGRVTNVFEPIRCVAIRVKSGPGFKQGDLLQFIKGEPDKEMLGSHNSHHRIDSIEIDHQPVEEVMRGQHCAVYIDTGPLPPNNCEVLLVRSE